MMRLFYVTMVMVLFSCNKNIQPGSATANVYKEERAKNIILLIGDGMGLGQITAGMIANGNYTALEKFSHTGLHKCFAYDNLITDSAAAATAFACGIKTYNGAIAVDPDTLPVETILEEAEMKNMVTGMIATSTIVHATPASFIAHNRQRRNYEEIAADFLKTEIDFFVGGGKKFFDRREDGRNLVEDLKAKGYQVSDYFNEELTSVKINSNKFAYLTSDVDPLPVAGGRDYLQVATRMGLGFLSTIEKDGFFLMIEGSQIDWGGHANVSDYIVSEFIEFDTVIGEVLEWAIRDKNTLVIVTADHETGGYSINTGSTMDSLVTAFTSDYHTATMIPVFAHGPGAHLFSGIYENTEIYHKMRQALGWED